MRNQPDTECAQACIAVVIPCYQVGESIFDVLDNIGPEVKHVFCVDDGSTDETVEIIEQVSCYDTRVQLIRRKVNGGVGAAVLDGYRAAIDLDADVIVKVDGDGQMDPHLISRFCEPILAGTADYVKGNRFFFLDSVRSMPGLRIVGNAGLSFLTKLSTGYWEIFDPTNGYTAIHAKVAQTLPFDRIYKRYFFESDLLFRLGVIRARVVDLPLQSVYGAETSHLNVWHCLVRFPGLHLKNLVKRITYNYFLRNFSIASVNLMLGLILCSFGLTFGVNHWVQSAYAGRVASAGTVMLAALPVILGFQLLLNFLSFDMSMTPREPLQQRLSQIQLLKSGAKESIREQYNPQTKEHPCLPK
jgi:glycosyltransferase involved in cell wall biosynthesis